MRSLHVNVPLLLITAAGSQRATLRQQGGDRNVECRRRRWYRASHYENKQRRPQKDQTFQLDKSLEYVKVPCREWAPLCRG